MPLESFAHAAYGSGAGTTESPDQPAATLRPGWYPDPHLRWRARYWDGRVWTDRVACPGQDPTRPVFGQDAVAPPEWTEVQAERTEVQVAPRLLRLVDVTSTSELTHLRAEVERWRAVAEERGRALAGALKALESLAPGRELPSAAPTERGAAPVEPAPRSALVTIPDAVRAAALNELHTVTLKQSGRTLKQRGRFRRRD
jgi:Protein of unknown function (DUF2510)